ncbi:MAG: bifunctional UDP-N-acetylglucosamine diphosphorylase/glucosamine-1-phosphate N-acetyltransferase GlmU [Nitrospiria bacterium]
MLTECAAVILAAGKGTRMKSRLAKVLHPVAGVPMLRHVIDLVQSLGIEKNVVIVGHQAEAVSSLVSEKGSAALLQDPPKGTGDAVLQAKTRLSDFQGPVLILNGDTPLLGKETVERFVEYYQKEQAAVGLLTVSLDHPAGYGRVVRKANGAIARIVEEKDASPDERRIREVNAGVYLCDAAFLFKALSKIKPDNQQKEYYLTDIIGIAVSEGLPLVGMEAPSEEVIGINSRADLAKAEHVMRSRINDHWMRQGVTMIDPTQVWIDATVTLGEDTVLYPGVALEGGTTVGAGVTVYPARIRDSHIGDGVLIKDHCVVDQAEVAANVTLGPFAHLRPGAVIQKSAKVGNFVEVKKSVLGEGSKASHLSYLGDAKIGKNVNIGAGTITCNYDGERKFETVIEDDVFIGSDTQLVAPVRVGKGALIGAGTTVTEDVPPDALALSRLKQENKADWVKQRKRLRKRPKEKQPE